MKKLLKFLRKNKELAWIFSALALVGGFYLANIFLNQPEKIEFGLPKQIKWVSPQSENLPDDLYSYDMTKNGAFFSILGVLPEQKALRLEFNFPGEYRGEVIYSKIACQPEETFLELGSSDEESKLVNDFFEKNFEKLSVEELNNALKKEFPAKGQFLNQPVYKMPELLGASFRGICADEKCASVVAKCSVLSQVSQENQEK